VFVGVTALPLAWLVSSGSPLAVAAAIAWNAIGLLDFVVAIAVPTDHIRREGCHELSHSAPAPRESTFDHRSMSACEPVCRRPELLEPDTDAGRRAGGP